MAQMTVLRRRMIDDMTGSQPLASNPAILRPAGGAGAAGIHPDPRYRCAQPPDLSGYVNRPPAPIPERLTATISLRHNTIELNEQTRRVLIISFLDL